MLEIAICDDDPLLAGKIENMLQKLSDKYHIYINVEVFNDGCELEKFMNQGMRFDIIYMDIEMKYRNGLETAREIRKTDKIATLIYVTSHEHYMAATFDFRPFQFIVKPIQHDLFEKYFLKAYEEIIQCDFYFRYRYNKAEGKVLVRDIMYFESQKRSISIKCAATGEKRFYDKLNNVEMALKNTKARFLRIHQSFLVNYKYITELSYDTVVLTDGTSLSISEDKRKRISEEYCEIVGSQSVCL